MQKLWVFVKNYREVIGYSVLAVLLFVACFLRPFAWVAAVWAVVLGVILRQETKLLGLILFLHCFYMLFNYHTEIMGISLDIIVLGILILMICALYVRRVIEKEQQLNWKVLIPILLFLVYVMMPFHECYGQDLIAMVFFFALLYVVFEDRKQIDFRYLVRIFVFGLVVSCVFALFKDVSPLLSAGNGANIGHVSVNGHVRFQGLTMHPNLLTRLVMLAIAGLLILQYRQRIGWVEFLVEFVPLFVFGYLTLSRSFVITVAVAVVLFAVFYLVRRKVMALPFLGMLLAIVSVVCLVFFSSTQVYFERITDDTIDSHETQNVIFDASVSTEEHTITDLGTTNIDDLLKDKPQDWVDGVFAGTVFFDPGRAGLRDLYLKDWASSAKTVLFGRGISRPLIAQMSAHNLLVQELWKHGLVGYLFYIAILVCAINWKKVKEFKRYLPILMIVVPYFLITLVEQCLLDYISMSIILSAVGYLEQTADVAVDPHAPVTTK